MTAIFHVVLKHTINASTQWQSAPYFNLFIFFVFLRFIHIQIRSTVSYQSINLSSLKPLLYINQFKYKAHIKARILVIDTKVSQLMRRSNLVQAGNSICAIHNLAAVIPGYYG